MARRRWTFVSRCRDHRPVSGYRIESWYFSNYIEGTVFTLPEAKALLYEDVVPVGRNADGHDVVGTYRLVADPTEMQRTATHADELLMILQSRHAMLMSGRVQANPGEFKSKPNQAGNTNSSTQPLLREPSLKASLG